MKCAVACGTGFAHRKRDGLRIRLLPAHLMVADDNVNRPLILSDERPRDNVRALRNDCESLAIGMKIEEEFVYAIIHSQRRYPSHHRFPLSSCPQFLDRLRIDYGEIEIEDDHARAPRPSAARGLRLQALV